ncbi:MFS transporter [Demequina aurantiaca]|uniref:MFS transporter n=1 Tax=Demequina aurantiaca TaxID=676200 RepID=UPI00078658E6|nr:MFS transporter [Demequina aurantiaca]
MSRTFASLSIYNYRLWFAGAIVSNVGTWMQRVAQDWLVLTVLSQDSGVAVGIVTALQFLPFLLLTAWAGVLADRVDQRKLLLFTQSASAALGIGLGALVLLGHVQLWHVYIFALLLGIVSAIDAPARQTFVAELVPTENLPNAVGLNSASFNAARLVGPAVAGLVIAWLGIGWVFIVNGFTFIATILALLAMRSSELAGAERAPRKKGQIREGFRYVRRRPDIVVVLIIVSVVGMLGLNFQLTSALMARTEFGMGPSQYGILGSVLAIGSLAGALLAARRSRVRVRLVIGAAFGFGIATAINATMPTFTLYAITCIPVGFAALTMITSANAMVQTTTSPAMRGRVMSLYMMLFVGTTPIGSPIVGWVGEEFGARWAIGVGSIAALLVSTGAAVWAVRYWRLDVSYHLHKPRLRITYPPTVAARDAADADRQAREEASSKIRSQQIEDKRSQA